jgi:hypothetical protein
MALDDGQQLYLFSCIAFACYVLILLRVLYMLIAYVIQHRQALQSSAPSFSNSSVNSHPVSPGSPVKGTKHGRILRSFLFIACFAFLQTLTYALHISREYTKQQDSFLHALFIFSMFFFFMVYSVLLYNWRSVAKLVSSNYQPSRYPLAIINIVVLLVTVTDWILYFSYRNSEDRNTVVGMMNLFIACTCFTISIAFWNIGGRLMYMLYAKSLHKSKAHTVAFRKILIMTVVSSICLAVYGGFIAWEGAYLVKHNGFMVVIDGEYVQIAALQYVYLGLQIIPTVTLLVVCQTGPAPTATRKKKRSIVEKNGAAMHNPLYSGSASSPQTSQKLLFKEEAQPNV